MSLLLVVSALVATPAVAGTVYRCKGADGIPSYSSKRLPGARCVAVSRYTAHTYKKPVAPPAPAGAGSAAPATDVAGSPASASLGAGGGAPAQPPKKPRFVRMATSTTYSYIDRNGVRNYSSRRPAGIANVTVTRTEYPVFIIDTCYACTAHPGVSFARVPLNTASFGDEIRTASRQYGVEESIVRAIIHAESAFNPRAMSRVGAQGLMQLMPATARRFGVGDAFDAGQNIRGGVQYLAWLLRRYQGDLTKAAAGYNAGEGAVDKYGGVPPYSETRRYVERVGILADRYRGALAAR